MRIQRWFQLALVTLLTFGWLGVAQAQPVEINWWYANTGVIADTIKKIIENYNGSQTKYKVIGTYKGSYTETVNQTIAAFRANQPPELVQVFEVGTQTMMMSGAIYPVYKLMEEQGIKVDWSKYVQPVLSYYVDPANHLQSMPFNSSTPIFYYNKNHFAKAGLTVPPKTWQKVDQYITKLRASGQQCAYTTAWISWVHLENYSALHGVPFASNANGFKGLSTVLEFNGPKQLAHFNLLNKWVKDGSMSYEGRSGNADPAFSSGKCSMGTHSSGNIGNFTRDAKNAKEPFEWGAAPMPVDAGTPLRNSTIGGASLWVLKGHTKEQYAAVADFLRYVATPDVQVLWHRATGYVPITVAAYQLAKKQGYYKELPAQEVAIRQLTRSKTTELSRGLRLGNFVQIRDVIDEETENIWAGKKTPKQGLDDAVRRGNELLRQFEQMQK